MLYSHKEILYSIDNKSSRATYSNMNESQKYNFEMKKPNTNSKNYMISFM